MRSMGCERRFPAGYCVQGHLVRKTMTAYTPAGLVNCIGHDSRPIRPTRRIVSAADLEPQSGNSTVPEASASGKRAKCGQAPEERKPAFASPKLTIAAGSEPVARATGTGLPLLRSYAPNCPNVTVVIRSILRARSHATLTNSKQ